MMKLLDLLAERALLQLAAFYSEMGIALSEDGVLPARNFDYMEQIAGMDIVIDDEKRRMRQYQIVRTDRAAEVCGLGAPGRLVIELALAARLHPKLLPQMRKLGTPCVSLGLAWEMLQLNYGSNSPDYAEIHREYKGLTRLFAKPQIQPILQAPMEMDDRLFGYLCGSNEPDERIADIAELFLFDTPIFPVMTGADVLGEIVSVLQKPSGGILLHLAGEDGSGKKFLLKHACNQVLINMLFVDYKALKGSTNLGDVIFRELALHEAGVCFYGVDKEGCKGDDIRRFVRDYIKPLYSTYHYICVCSDGAALVPHMELFVHNINIPPIDRNMRITVWEGYCSFYGITQHIDCVIAGSRYRLSNGEIAKAAKRLSGIANMGMPIGMEVLAQVAQEVLPPPTQGNIRKIHVTFTFDDLKLPKEQLDNLQNICAHEQQRHKVYDTWGMEAKYPYGRNISALFVGAPGTGKTMAVHVLSSHLGIPLYRIDLSQIVDKYIGETEKRLEEVFTLAEKSNIILFFDEADSIFGKRSEVNDAKDKYANTEVSYILQRIESYDGIVVLATNYKNNIDEAFLRRIRYLVEFPMPGAELRQQIWRSSFADDVPLEEVDFEFLARSFEMSGGLIKNIVLNATFLAADEGTSVNMKHILRSLRSENYKHGKSMIDRDFFEYSDVFLQ